MKAHDCVLGAYELHFRQQPQQAQAIGALSSLKRPIEPPPIIELRPRSPSPLSTPSERLTGLRWPDARKPEGRAWRSRSQNPNYFCHAQLVPASPTVTGDGGESEGRALVGTSVSSLYLLPDLDGGAAAVFTFPDCSVREKGWFKLKMTMFELVQKNVFWCCSILSSAFYVFGELDYPGPLATTELSRVLARSGHKIRVPKRIRLKRIQTEDAPAACSPMTSPSSSSSRSAGSMHSTARPGSASRGQGHGQGQHTPREMRSDYAYPARTPANTATRPSFRPYPSKRPQSSSQSAPTTPRESKREGSKKVAHAIEHLWITPARPMASQPWSARTGTQREVHELEPYRRARPMPSPQAPMPPLSAVTATKRTPVPSSPANLRPERPSDRPHVASSLLGWPAPAQHTSPIDHTPRQFGAIDGPLTLPPILGDKSASGDAPSPDSAIFSGSGPLPVTRTDSSSQMRIDRLLL